MAYICTREEPCKSCPHYRFDDDYAASACFAQVDIENIANKEAN